MKTKFRVLLPIDVEGRIYEFGSVVELSLETAKKFSHALMACEEEELAGGPRGYPACPTSTGEGK